VHLTISVKIHTLHQSIYNLGQTRISRIGNRTKVRDVMVEKNNLNDNIILWEANVYVLKLTNVDFSMNYYLLTG